jgi:hypothetical protein
MMLKRRWVALLLTLTTTIAPCLFLSQRAAAQKPARGRARTIRFEPNVYAPDLYADTLKMKFTLINLPGAESSGSYWEGEYQLFFIPEGELSKIRKSEPRPEDFPGRILLAEGKFKSSLLKTLPNRTVVRGPMAFKSKVPDSLRTKFANILTTYSIKIYDARLKSRLYKSGIFISHPFDDDEMFSSSGRLASRQTIYTNFFVAPDGDLYYSQWRREGNDTNW